MSDLFDMSRFEVVKESKVTERGDLLTQFLDRLNPPRVKGGFSKMSYPFLSKKLQGIKTADLYTLYKECAGADNFSKLFWYKMKRYGNNPNRRT